MCDKRFHVDSFVPYFVNHDAVGVALIFGEEADIYTVQGTGYKHMSDVSVHRRKRQTKGGQSAHKFQMLRLEQIEGYVKKIAERINRAFLHSESGVPLVKFMVFLGCGPIKDQVAKSSHISKALTSLLKANINKDENYTIDQTIANVLPSLSTSVKDGVDNVKWLAIEEVLRSSPGLVAYGHDTVEKYLKEGLVKKLILATNMEEKMQQRFADCLHMASIVEWSSISNPTFDGFGHAIAILHYDIGEHTREELDSTK